MIQRGGVPDHARAAAWFVQWWRERGGLDAASVPPPKALEGGSPRQYGWGFDVEWTSDGSDTGADAIQRRMEACIDAHMADAAAQARAGADVSASQEKRKIKEERVARREARVKAMLAARGVSPKQRRS